MDRNICNVIYDCGSSSNRLSLRNEIDSFSSERKVVDILFISHFDNDHINGIKYMKDQNFKFKNVIIPLINSKDKFIYILKNIGDEDCLALIRNPQSFFGDQTRIIKVSSDSNGQSNRNESIDINVDESNENHLDETTIKNNQAISISNRISKAFWFYIPFNYCEKQREESLRNELNKLENKEINEFINSPNIEAIINLSKNINNIYKKVCETNSSNNASMIIFSGLYIALRTFVLAFYGHCYFSMDEACLYCGDIGLNQKNIIDDITGKLGFSCNHIGLIQVPHHGSKASFSDDIYKINTRCDYFFLSYGNHRYDFPSRKVLLSMVNNHKRLFLINENDVSIFVQEIFLY